MCSIQNVSQFVLVDVGVGESVDTWSLTCVKRLEITVVVGLGGVVYVS